MEFRTLINKFCQSPWRRGIVVNASAYRTEDPGFESRQGVRFFRVLYTFQCCCQNLKCNVIVCVFEKTNSSKKNCQSAFAFSTANLVGKHRISCILPYRGVVKYHLKYHIGPKIYSFDLYTIEGNT
jgi:hypothetical protein